MPFTVLRVYKYNDDDTQQERVSHKQTAYRQTEISLKTPNCGKVTHLHIVMHRPMQVAVHS